MSSHQNKQPQVSEREIERQYSKLEIKPAAENRTNCYICMEGHITKTIDRHIGVTPMFLSCPVCSTQATSNWYKDLYPEMAATHEWFVPTLEQVKKYRKNPAMLDHIFKGGLDFRKI